MRSRSACLAVALVFVLCRSSFANESSEQTLGHYLETINSAGLRIIYTSELVTDDLTLPADVAPATSVTDIESVLQRFGLTLKPGPSGSYIVTRSGDGIAERTDPVVDEPTPIPEIIVSTSLHRLDHSQPSTPTYVDKELATRIPTTAGEVVRLVDRLPGTANGGVSARTHVRGGEVNEVLFLFDGLRLYEPYHLKNFQSIATIVNAGAIEGMDFFTGAYPAKYGDRMSGVLDIAMRSPEGPRETELELNFFNASALSTGIFGSERQGEWLVTARRSNLDVVVDIVDPEIGRPAFNDILGHVAWDFGPRLGLSANLLSSFDKISLNDSDRGERTNARYSNIVYWLKWSADWSAVLSSESIVAYSDIADSRSGELALPGIVTGSLDEERDFHTLEFRQDWKWVPSDAWMLSFGFNTKNLDADYVFVSDQVIEAPFATLFDNAPVTSRGYALEPSGGQNAAYAELRLRPVTAWTFDFGLRWDQQSYTTAADDRQFSPRAGVLFQPGEATEIRLGWGQYYQAQEINELQLSDGIDEFFVAQRAEHFVVSVQHGFGYDIDASLSVYQKSFRTLRPRFENVFNTLTLVPELQFDRVRVDPSGAEAFGVELTVTKGAADDDLIWWFGYDWSRILDETESGKIRRSWDQTHTVKGGISWRFRQWNFSAAAEVRTGWPRTVLESTSVSLPDGSSELLLDPSNRNARRFSPYQVLDVRVSRDVPVSRGDLTAYLEVGNITNRANPCCTEFSLSEDNQLLARERHWLPMVPSLGVIWKF